jgi:disulfide bond formation protein DsbB
VTVDAMTLLFGLLTLAGWVALAGVVVVAAGARAGSAPLAGALGWLRDALDGQGLALAFLVAAVATGGSLYLSEVAHFVPCKLCWYQRIAMYPLAPLLALAALRRDRSVRWYVVLQAVLGGLVSLYHMAEERIGYLQHHGLACEVDNPCYYRPVERFGFMTIPVMAGTAFALIATTLLLVRSDVPEELA